MVTHSGAIHSIYDGAQLYSDRTGTSVTSWRGCLKKRRLVNTQPHSPADSCDLWNSFSEKPFESSESIAQSVSLYRGCVKLFTHCVGRYITACLSPKKSKFQRHGGFDTKATRGINSQRIERDYRKPLVIVILKSMSFRLLFNALRI